MELDTNNDDFEIFLKQKVDQHKLYPSERVWKSIYNSLHPGMRWLKIGGTLLVLTAVFVIYHDTSILGSNIFLRESLPEVQLANPNVENKTTSEAKTFAGVSQFSMNFLKTIPTDNMTKGALNSTKKLSPGFAGTQVSPDISVGDSKNTASSTVEKLFLPNVDLKGFKLHDIKTVRVYPSIQVAIPVNRVINAATKDQQVEDIAAYSWDAKPLSPTTIGNVIASEETLPLKEINWLHEMAAIRLTPRKAGNFNLQFYFSPTVSYRRLTDNQNSSHSGLLATSAISRDLNINRYVDHTPAIGVELGSNILFKVTRNLTLKSGLQLNYSRYNVKAFKYSYEKASIALNNPGSVPDTLSSYTSIRNFSGYAPEEMQNQYLQISVPVGAELKLLGNKRLQFSVAGTIQPTFLLFSDTYLLSTNYLNYTKEPSLVRKWNAHTSFEAFLSYKTGGLRWQLGPQFRYQLMSSFNDRYPIKEYLFEYGFKIGVSKTIR